MKTVDVRKISGLKTSSIYVIQSQKHFFLQEVIEEVSTENLVRGMTSQIGEREDHVIVDDLRSKSHPLIRNDDVIDKSVFEIFLDNCFGPLHFSRLDLVTMSIMRGRDHGLND